MYWTDICIINVIRQDRVSTMCILVKSNKYLPWSQKFQYITMISFTYSNIISTHVIPFFISQSYIRHYVTNIFLSYIGSSNKHYSFWRFEMVLLLPRSLSMICKCIWGASFEFPWFGWHISLFHLPLNISFILLLGQNDLFIYTMYYNNGYACRFNCL